LASISTDDIVSLLTQEYADTSERTNALHTNLSTFITKRIQDYSMMQDKKETEILKNAVSILEEIRKEVDRVSEKREDLLRPLSVLLELISQFFQYSGIRFTEGITLGEAKEAISSEKLSSGEKQMLSFLCYNAFTKNSTIFIDEPELSLHVDWQRLLFPTLLKQGTGNQFIVATHSPMIYSKYPDKELVLDTDKGGY
jgi:predicted ATP-dependent endonuclease of OLD family